jgi:hypothetical protein
MCVDFRTFHELDRPRSGMQACWLPQVWGQRLQLQDSALRRLLFRVVIFAGWFLTNPSTWQWLDPQQVIATTSVLTTLLLFAAGIAAWVQVAHARDARREQARPFVIIDVVASRAQLFRLEIKNIGKTVAKDVSVAFDPPLESTLDERGRKVRNIPILARGAPSLAPGKTHTFLLDKAPARKNSGLPDTYQVIVAYTGYDGTKYEDKQVIDLGVYWSTPDLREHDIHDIWHVLRDVSETLHGIHQAVVALQPPTKGHFPPLGRAVTRPGPIQEMPRSIEGGGLPASPPQDSDEPAD